MILISPIITEKVQSMAEATPDNIGGCILAGGLSTRMGEHEKCLMALRGKPLMGHVIDRLQRQASKLIINANGDPERFERFALPVVADTVDGFAGPLAGVLAAMDWYRENAPEVTHVLSVAGDTPYFPSDFLGKLAMALNEASKNVALAYFDGQRHPTFGLWAIDLRDALHNFLVEEGNRKIMLFVERIGFAQHDFACGWNNKYDPFFNVNTPEELSEAQSIYGVVNAD